MSKSSSSGVERPQPPSSSTVPVAAWQHAYILRLPCNGRVARDGCRVCVFLPGVSGKRHPRGELAFRGFDTWAARLEFWYIHTKDPRVSHLFTFALSLHHKFLCRSRSMTHCSRYSGMVNRASGTPAPRARTCRRVASLPCSTLFWIGFCPTFTVATGHPPSGTFSQRIAWAATAACDMDFH